MLRLLLILVPLLLGGCSFLWNSALSVRCSQSDECAEHGRCGVRTWRAGDRGWRCVVASVDQCAASEACRVDGACDLDPHLDPEACVATEPTHCLDSTGCLAAGRCVLAPDGSCHTGEAGCRASDACSEDERCAPSNERACGRAWADAVTWCDAPCDAEGACRRDGLSCRVESEADCRASTGCIEHGRCSLDAEAGVCVAASEADCAASSACREGLEDGARPCTLRGARCADASSACERSAHCLIRGDCTAMEGTCAPSDGSCAGTVECLVLGRCQHENHLCLPMEPAHCEASLECEAFGRCVLSSWLVHQCVDGSGVFTGPSYCASDPCLDEGRCLQDAAGSCHTPAEQGLEDPLPRRPARPEPAPEPPPLPPVEGRGLRTQLDGEDVIFTHALVGQRGGEARWVLLADGPVDCGQLADAAPPKDHSWVRLSLAPGLEERGALQVSRAAWHLASGGPGAEGGGDLGLGAVAGGRVALHVEHSIVDSRLWLDGAMDVHDCGSLPPVTRPRPQDGLRVELDGQPVPIAMALVDDILSVPTLILASQPVTCSWRHPQRGEPDLLVLVDAEGLAGLEGARIPGRLGVWGQGAPLELGVTDANDELEVGVSFEDPRANPSLITRGTARAVDCRP